jgi:hypothetical protein
MGAGGLQPFEPAARGFEQVLDVCRRLGALRQAKRRYADRALADWAVESLTRRLR